MPTAALPQQWHTPDEDRTRSSSVKGSRANRYTTGANGCHSRPSFRRASCEHLFVLRMPLYRQAARQLRKIGWSMRAIADHLDVSVSTVGGWVRDIQPPERDRAADDAPPPEALPVSRSGRWRECGRCGHTLPEELFARMGDARQWWCRRCFSGYHRANKDRATSRHEERLSAGRAYVLNYLRSTPCTDCGIDDPVVLEFDHVGVKREGVSGLVLRATPIARIRQELALCDVVCVNCHRRRTLARVKDRPTAGNSRRALRIRNLAYLRQVAAQRGCIDCGVRDPSVLDFDHVAEKSAGLSRLARSECSLARLDEEIARCVIRCANCHRRRTASARLFFRHRAS